MQIYNKITQAITTSDKAVNLRDNEKIVIAENKTISYTYQDISKDGQAILREKGQAIITKVRSKDFIITVSNSTRSDAGRRIFCALPKNTKDGSQQVFNLDNGFISRFNWKDAGQLIATECVYTFGL